MPRSVTYDQQTLEEIQDDKDVFFAQFKKLKNLSKRLGKELIYPNQQRASDTVLRDLDNNPDLFLILLIAMTQSGKTGMFLSIIVEFLKKFVIPISNIYILTGLSSTDWEDQTSSRFPECLSSRIIHGPNIQKVAEEIKEKNNVLVLIDEVQIASKVDQRIYKTFSEAGFYDCDMLRERNIVIVQCSATPNKLSDDLDCPEWAGKSKKLRFEPAPGYTSAMNLLSQGRVLVCKDLCGLLLRKKNISSIDDIDEKKDIDPIVWNNIEEIRDAISTYPNYRYHIIRTSTGLCSELTQRNFKRFFPENEYDYVQYVSGDSININDILKVCPTRHTFIFLKEKMRCANTLVKQFLGVLYERYSENPEDSVVIQGLLGRDTGYDNNGDSIHFSFPDSIRRYEKLWMNNFSSRSCPEWNGGRSKKQTINDHGNYSTSDSDSESSTTNEAPVLVIVISRSFEQIKKYFTTHLKDSIFQKTGKRKNGPSCRKPNSQGFYESTIRGETKVRSTTELNHNRGWGLTPENPTEYIRCHPCYSNIEDPTTLEWWMIFYEFREQPNYDGRVEREDDVVKIFK